MKTLKSILSISLFCLLFILSNCTNPDEIVIGTKHFYTDSQSKKEILTQMKYNYENGKYHKGAVLEIAQMVTASNHNLDVLSKASYLVSTAGFHTSPVMDIAKIASKATVECEELNPILELAMIKMSGSREIVDLAQRAVETKNEIDKEQIRAKIDELKALAEYKTVEEAIAGNM